jgi:NhaP-type Na+/H+ or K+/H+ antiporter
LIKEDYNLIENIMATIAGIIVLGITAQWVAWRLRIPSILLLLLLGFVAGPITGLLNPDELLADLLFPLVSLSVALILFEGGLNLRISELQVTGHVVRNLVTIGVVVGWVLNAAAASFILGFDFPIALLFGAILVVTGPTVIMPLLRHIRAVGRVSSIIKWEGIVNDPIGAILAVLVFEAVVASGVQESTTTVIISLVQTIVIAAIFGGLVAWALIHLLKRYWIPDYLQNSVILMAVIAAFTVSNGLQKESGLFTVTVMGLILANQRAISVKHILEFKENLGVLLLSSLFIILAARLRPEDLSHLGGSSLLFLAALMLVIRPITILVSTIKSGLAWREKLFLSWMAPRGIVAAAVTAIFALELAEEAGYHQAELMVPEMFLIIVGTVTIYGLSAAPLGRWLGVAQPDPQGVLMVGAHGWVRTIASALQAEGYDVLLIDTNRENLNQARLAGIPTAYASILSEHVLDEIEIGSLGRLFALTSNDEVNSLASLHFIEVFGREKVYQLVPKESGSGRKEPISMPLRGRLLFAPDMTYSQLTQRFAAGAVVKTTKLTGQFDYDDFLARYGSTAVPLLLIDETGNLRVFTTDQELFPRPGETLISLVAPTDQPVNGQPS